MQENQNQSFIWEWFKKNQAQWMSMIQSGNEEPAEERAPGGGRVDDQWLKLWDKSMQKLFNIPQIGLARFYQEKVNQASEKYCRFQGSLARLCVLLSTPLETSSTQW